MAGNSRAKAIDDTGADQDIICFEHHVFADFAAVHHAMSQVGTSVFITVDYANAVEIENTIAAALGADDFLFV